MLSFIAYKLNIPFLFHKSQIYNMLRVMKKYILPRLSFLSCVLCKRNCPQESNPSINSQNIEALMTHDKNTPLFSLNGQRFTCKVVYVYDGDTIHVVFPFNGQYNKWKCRIIGVDTPELRTHNEEEKKFGYTVKHALSNHIENKIVVIQCFDFDKYGRLLVDIDILPSMVIEGHSDITTVSEWLIHNKYANRYDGGTKKRWETIQSKIEEEI
jgi:micrococcal nuclease